MHPPLTPTAAPAPLGRLNDLDRYAVVTDYDPDFDDLAREIDELRNTLANR